MDISAPPQHRPAGSEAAQCIVEAAGNRNKLSRYCGIEIGSAKPRGPLKRSVLVEDDAFSSTSAAHGRKFARRVVEPRYSARFIIGCSHIQMGWDAQMASCNLDKSGSRFAAQTAAA